MKYDNEYKAWRVSEIEQLRSMHEAKHTVAQIAEVLKRSPNAVHKQLTALGLKRYHTKRNIVIPDNIAVAENVAVTTHSVVRNTPAQSMSKLLYWAAVNPPTEAELRTVINSFARFFRFRRMR